MSAAGRLLSRLDGVRQTAPGRWLAKCPSHDDRRPSLSVREAEDGRLLVYCFTGCGAIDVLGALGLDFASLFPPRLDTTPPSGRRRRREAPPIPAQDALRILDQEALVVQLVARRLAEGEPVERHAEALDLAAERIGSILNAWELAP